MQTTNKTQIQRSGIQLNGLQGRLLLLAGLLLAWIGAGIFVATQDFVSWDLRNNIWSPLHLLVQGRSPFDLKQLYQHNENAIWFPMSVGAFFPLGYMTAAQASSLWFLLSAGAYAAFIPLARPASRPKPLWLAFLLLAILIFPPFVSHMLLGQYSILAALLMLLAAAVAALLADYLDGHSRHPHLGGPAADGPADLLSALAGYGTRLGHGLDAGAECAGDALCVDLGFRHAGAALPAHWFSCAGLGCPRTADAGLCPGLGRGAVAARQWPAR